MATLNNITFKRCKFERLELSEANLEYVKMIECEINSVVAADALEEVAYRPDRIVELLEQVSVSVEDASRRKESVRDTDERIVLLERVLRAFLRTTQISETVTKVRLGQRSANFIDHVIPQLMRAGVLQEAPHHGSGNQRRFKPGVPMSKIEETLAQSSGEFGDFIGRIG